MYWQYLGQMYPAELEIEDTTESNTSASYFGLLLSTERTVSCALPFTTNVTVSTSISQTLLGSNIPSSPAYGVFISQLIRYVRACSSYDCFILRAARLSSKLLGQGYVMECLKSSLRKLKLWLIWGSHQTLCLPLPNVTRHSGT